MNLWLTTARICIHTCIKWVSKHCGNVISSIIFSRGNSTWVLSKFPVLLLIEDGFAIFRGTVPIRAFKRSCRSMNEKWVKPEIYFNRHIELIILPLHINCSRWRPNVNGLTRAIILQCWLLCSHWRGNLAGNHVHLARNWAQHWVALGLIAAFPLGVVYERGGVHGTEAIVIIGLKEVVGWFAITSFWGGALLRLSHYLVGFQE